MEIPDELALERFLKNAALLLEGMRSDAHALQARLAALLEARSPKEASFSQADLIMMQSLDQFTQILEDLAQAFLSSSGAAEKNSLQRWQAIADEMKLEHVRQILTHGERRKGVNNHIEIF